MVSEWSKGGEGVFQREKVNTARQCKKRHLLKIQFIIVFDQKVCSLMTRNQYSDRFLIVVVLSTILYLKKRCDKVIE